MCSAIFPPESVKATLKLSPGCPAIFEDKVTVEELATAIMYVLSDEALIALVSAVAAGYELSANTYASVVARFVTALNVITAFEYPSVAWPSLTNVPSMMTFPVEPPVDCTISTYPFVPRDTEKASTAKSVPD